MLTKVGCSACKGDGYLVEMVSERKILQVSRVMCPWRNERKEEYKLHLSSILVPTQTQVVVEPGMTHGEQIRFNQASDQQPGLMSECARLSWSVHTRTGGSVFACAYVCCMVRACVSFVRVRVRRTE